MADPVLPEAPGYASGNDASALKPNAPGFWFHPTDEELITYYLKRKVQGKPIRYDAIAEVNLYKHEPSDLPEHSRLKTKDQEWFFFCALEKSRATKKGYWKKTGDDKQITIKRGGEDKLIGVVKSLVFYRGRAPKGNRTNWIIHEYHLVANNREIDTYVLCRVFRKEHAGPSTGCIYAPFSDQDWADDDCGGINGKIQQENHLQSKNELLREFDIDEDPTTVDQEARDCLPLPLIKYKRTRQTTHDHSSFPAKEENEPEPEPATTVPRSSSTELINHLEKEKQKMAVEAETYQLDLMKAEMMVSLLKREIDVLREENEELKKRTNSSNKG